MHIALIGGPVDESNCWFRRLLPMPRVVALLFA